jgi:hypothetical protein
MAKRHGTWRFTGERSADGRPLRFFTGIPARDLAERDVTLLDDEQYATVEASDLYERVTPKPPARRTTSGTTKRAGKKSLTTPETAGPDPVEPAAPDTAETPAPAAESGKE